MKGLVLHGPYDLRYEDAADPELHDIGDALIKIDGCSICGSDLHTFRGHGYSQATGNAAAGVIGHEAIGEVIETGRGVRNFRPGDKVMLSAAVGCGSCQECHARNPLKCTRIGFRSYGGTSGLGGCQGEAVVAPAADFNLGLIPEGISPEQALMLTDNLPTAFMGCSNANIGFGAMVGIIGLGPIGLMAVECAFLMGAERVFAIDFDEPRREIAKSLGAEVYAPDVAIDEIEAATNGLMPSSIIDAAGGANALKLALKLCAKAGTVSSIGLNLEEVAIPMMDMFLKGITFHSSVCSVASYWPALIPMVQSGRLRPERFVSHTLSLADGPDAYAMLDARRAGALKVILMP